MLYKSRPKIYSLFYENTCTGWYFLGYDYNTHKKKLFNILDYFSDVELKHLKENGVKFKMLGDKNETDFCICNRKFIHDVESYLHHPHVEQFKENDLDVMFYVQYKYFPLTIKYREFNIRFNDMSEKFYSVTYDGDVEGKDYEGLLALNEAGKEDYFQDHGKYPVDDEPEEQEETWDYELRFEYSDKNKAIKDSNGQSRKLKSCLEIDDKAYYDLINTKDITCKHIINYLTLQINDFVYDPGNKTKEGDLVNKVGDDYPIKTLRDVKKYMKFEGQFMILVHTKNPETDLIKKMSVHLVERENHFMYYFHKVPDIDGIPLMRIIPVPDLSMNPVDRKLHSDEGAYVNGFAMYDYGVIFAGGQNDGNFVNYALAKEQNVRIPDNILLKN